MGNNNSQMCEMCSLLLTLLDKIEMETDDLEILKITRQRFEVAEQEGLEVIFSEVSETGLDIIQ